MCSSAETPQITTNLDSFILDKDSTIWICKLDNGLTVYQDDDRDGLIPSAWIRLKKYCHSNNVNINEMSIKFRSHEEFVGKDADGFFFRKAILGGIGLNRKEKPVNRHYYLVGYLKNGVVEVTKWQVPELESIEKETRNPNDQDLVGDSLIVNPKNKQI